MQKKNLTDIVYCLLINKRLGKKVKNDNDLLYYYVCAEYGVSLVNVSIIDFFRTVRKKAGLPSYEQLLRAKRGALKRLEEKNEG